MDLDVDRVGAAGVPDVEPQGRRLVQVHAGRCLDVDGDGDRLFPQGDGFGREGVATGIDGQSAARRGRGRRFLARRLRLAAGRFGVRRRVRLSPRPIGAQERRVGFPDPRRRCGCGLGGLRFGLLAGSNRIVPGQDVARHLERRNGRSGSFGFRTRKSLTLALTARAGMAGDANRIIPSISKSRRPMDRSPPWERPRWTPRVKIVGLSTPPRDRATRRRSITRPGRKRTRSAGREADEPSRAD